MLKLGSTTYRIQHSRDHEKVLLTVWRGGKLAEHKIHRLRRTKDGADFFYHGGQMFYVSEFIDPNGSYRTPTKQNPYTHEATRYYS